MTRKITTIVHHCSASRPKQAMTQTAADINAMHKKERGWRKIGYHYFIRHNGMLEKGREEAEVGAGVFGFNANALHICYAGGLNEAGKGEDTRTLAQKQTQARLMWDLNKRYPVAKAKGHRDFSPDKDGDGKVEKHEWMKECPCFEVSLEPWA